MDGENTEQLDYDEMETTITWFATIGFLFAFLIGSSDARVVHFGTHLSLGSCS